MLTTFSRYSRMNKLGIVRHEISIKAKLGISSLVYDVLSEIQSLSQLPNE